MENNFTNNNFDKKVKVACSFQQSCSGCQYLELSYEEQVKLKLDQLRNILLDKNIQSPETIEFLSAGPEGLRDRLDFSFESGSLGLYRKDTREVLDLPYCKQLSPQLQEWLTQARKIHWPFKKGSLRLRVGPEGQKGVWLDLANLDVKSLLEEKQLLLGLMDEAFVEIGQRRKTPTLVGSQIKLKDPEHRIWFQTWTKNIPVNLYCQVASFTQPSLQANKLICSKLDEWISEFPHSRIIEFGSGIGNLTFPVAGSAHSILACEIDRLSLEGLKKSIEELPEELHYLKNKISIYAGDFQKKLGQEQDFSQFDGVLANPPRSGLMGFLDPLVDASNLTKPKFFIYMSCFPETLALDLKRLQQSGYHLEKVSLVDQFPQTKHYEVLALLQRK